MLMEVKGSNYKRHYINLDDVNHITLYKNEFGEYKATSFNSGGYTSMTIDKLGWDHIESVCAKVKNSHGHPLFINLNSEGATYLINTDKVHSMLLTLNPDSESYDVRISYEKGTYKLKVEQKEWDLVVHGKSNHDSY